MHTYEALFALGLFAAAAATVVLVALKLVGVITWAWPWTLSPLGLFLGLCAPGLVGATLVSLHDTPAYF